MASKEVASEVLPLIRVYKDGTVERLTGSPFVPPSPQPHPDTAVSSKDVLISPAVSARLFLPKLTPTNSTSAHHKLPILVHFHGGGFCLESAFSLDNHRYLSALVSEAQALALSVEYRNAPEHPLPAAYQDCWQALQWLASHSLHNPAAAEEQEAWLIRHADFDRVFVGGDSAGGNIAHNMAMRAGLEGLPGGVKIGGAFLCHPYFWSSRPLDWETSEEQHKKSLMYRIWVFVYPDAEGGIDNPMVNPLAEGAPSLSELGCSRLLVCVAEKDELRGRGVWYYEAVKKSGWGGKIELYDGRGEDHVYHILNPHTQNAKTMIKVLASFINPSSDPLASA